MSYHQSNTHSHLLKHEYLRMSDLATTAERKTRQYTTKDGTQRIIKGQPAKRGLLPFGESTLWTKTRKGEFPAPVKLSDRITAWKTIEVLEWMKSKEITRN